MISVVILGVVMLTATSYTQLVIALLFYPPLAYFMLRVSTSSSQPAKVTTLEPQVVTEVKENVADGDKRAFLKLIGSVGLSLFLYSIFTRKSEALFFGKAAESGVIALEDKDGNKIDPAQKQPTDGYQISEIDEGEPFYCGYTNKLGNWYIMKQDSDTGSFRYVKGDAGFPENWEKRNNFRYDYFYKVFTTS